MKKYLLGLIVITFSLVNVSLADFQSETTNCHNNQNKEKCQQQVRNKYLVKKEKACTLQEGKYNLPLEVKRSSKATNDGFYIYKKVIYYPVRVFPKNNIGFEQSYFYMYNCHTKKAKDLAIVNHKSDFDDDYINLVAVSESNIVLNYANIGDPTNYFLFDTKTNKKREVKIESMKGFQVYKATVKKATKKLYDFYKPERFKDKTFEQYRKDAFAPMGGAAGYQIESISDMLTGKLVFYTQIKGSLSLATIDLINNTISLNK